MRKLPLVACYACTGFSLFTEGLSPVYRYIMRFNEKIWFANDTSCSYFLF